MADLVKRLRMGCMKADTHADHRDVSKTMLNATARIAALEAWITAEAEARGADDAEYPPERQCAVILAGKVGG